jgi:hypothetical protein
MPFTFCHPAAVLPAALLPRRWYSFTGLVAGSIAPDFEYFARMEPRSHVSHSIEGLLMFNLPVGLLIAIVFHLIVRDVLIAHLPALLRQRFSTFMLLNWSGYLRRHWVVVCVSVLVGAFTHVLWDSFTHGNAYFVNAIPALQYAFTIMGYELPVYKMLQHGSSFAGGLILLFAIWKMPTAEISNTTTYYSYWLKIAGVSFALLLLRVLTDMDDIYLGSLVVSAITAGLVAVVVVSAGFVRWGAAAAGEADNPGNMT